jgi:glycosyltransferase involved in cell wall biosynthesis
MSKIRTLLNINNYHYRRGGADVAYLAQSELFENNGWNVVSFSMEHTQNLESKWSPFFPREIEYGRSYGIHRKAESALKSIYSWEAARKIGALIEHIRPDVAHAHNIYHHLSPSILPVLKRHGIPIFLTLHDVKLLCPARTMFTGDSICEACKDDKLRNVVFKKCMKGSLPLSALVYVESTIHRMMRVYEKNVSRFVSPSLFLLNKFVEWGWSPSRFVHIPNFVDATMFRPEYAPGKAFLYFGRLSNEKGLTTLVRAASAANVPVWIVGTGPEEPALRALAQSIGADVTFFGFQVGEALWDLVRRARAVVLPSEVYENAPISILEAYALGKCVVGSQIGGIPEIVRPRETGVLFEAMDVRALAEALSEVATLSNSRLSEWGERARTWVLEDFSPTRHYERLTKLYFDGSIAGSDST